MKMIPRPQRSILLYQTFLLEVTQYMFISTYQLLNMFQATMCPSSGADDLLVFSLTRGVVL